MHCCTQYSRPCIRPLLTHTSAGDAQTQFCLSLWYPHKRLTQTCPCVSRRLRRRHGSTVACCRVRRLSAAVPAQDLLKEVTIVFIASISMVSCINETALSYSSKWVFKTFVQRPYIKKIFLNKISLEVQWLRHYTSNAGDTGFVSDWENAGVRVSPTEAWVGSGMQ